MTGAQRVYRVDGPDYGAALAEQTVKLACHIGLQKSVTMLA
jgi:hypothetical protein